MKHKPATRKPAIRRRDTLRFAVVRSALGSVLVAGGRRGIVAILLGENPRRCVEELEELFPKAELEEASATEEDAAAEVAAHIEDPNRPLRMKIDLRGTPFQVQVWNVVRRVPPGKTLTYADVARKIGAPRAMRAVGSTCAKCRHLFAVPCHRVTASGTPTQNLKRPGADRRAALLQREIELLAARGS
jgi:AraC family transcriptional regulator of adaptative response/methylated-DNA-[protein]-cysteine methyltransferase